jgi:hypothetical protein
MKAEIIREIGIANIIALCLALSLCSVYDFLYRKFLPYHHGGFWVVNNFISFVLPVIIFITNWEAMKGRNIYLRLIGSFACTLIVETVFWFLISMLNIDKPFRLNGLLAI